MWEAWVMVFNQKKQLKASGIHLLHTVSSCSDIQAIAPHIPTSNPQLSESVYELVLAFFLNEDYVRWQQSWG